MESETIQGYRKLRQIYENNLTVELLSENIETCEIYDGTAYIKNEMIRRNFDVYGVKKDEKIIGFVRKEDLTGEGSIGDVINYFSSDELISDSTSLIELLDIFQEREFLFILQRNKVSRIITIADLQKHPIRMLAFSLISLFEMYLISLIKETYPDDSWTKHVKEERLNKAIELLNERLEKNEELTLLDNVQLSDKGTIVLRTADLIGKLGFQSKTQCKTFFRKIEELRNNTAHSQQKIYPDFKELISILLHIEKVLQNSV